MRWTVVFVCLVGCSSTPKESPLGDDGSGDTSADPVDAVDFNGVGTFQLELAPPRNDNPGEAAILGTVLDGPTPGTVVWELETAEGDCALLTPRVPFCDPGCDSSEACVEDDECQPYPTAIEVGTVTVEGVETTTGTTGFSMEPVAGYYQPAADIDLSWPPFAEGDVVTFTASGNATVPPFTMTAHGIAPLTVSSETITFTDGESVELAWAPGAEPDRTVMHISVNISYHSGTKGMISCQTPDSGTLELSGAMLDELKALGISGWPIIVFSRSTPSTTDPDVAVDLLIESSVTRNVEIPGLISCNSDADCPEDQTCQFDFQCG
jgi:hypothetical protein